MILGWHRLGIPLERVWGVIDEIVVRRECGDVTTVRYLDAPVLAAHQLWCSLNPPSPVASDVPDDTGERLENLRSQLENLRSHVLLAQGRHNLPALRVADDLAELCRRELTTPEAEGALQELNSRWFAGVEGCLDPETRREIEDELSATVAGLRRRLASEAVEEARGRLYERVVRQRFEMANLSLFSPEATEPIEDKERMDG